MNLTFRSGRQQFRIPETIQVTKKGRAFCLCLKEKPPRRFSRRHTCAADETQRQKGRPARFRFRIRPRNRVPATAASAGRKGWFFPGRSAAQRDIPRRFFSAAQGSVLCSSLHTPFIFFGRLYQVPLVDTQQKGRMAAKRRFFPTNILYRLKGRFRASGPEASRVYPASYP